MKKIKFKYWNKIQHREKLSRKTKKAILGTRMSKSKLMRKIDSLHLGKRHDDCTEESLNDYFCPSCGCKESRTVDHHVPYPEVWYEDFCARCNEYVGGADNSNYHHILDEIKSNLYAEKGV